MWWPYTGRNSRILRKVSGYSERSIRRLNTGYVRVGHTLCWLISVDRCSLFEGQQQNESSRTWGCPIYRGLVSHGTLVLMTSSFWWHTSPLYAGFFQKRGNFRGDAGIKGVFFPLEGQFLLERRRGKYSSPLMTVLIRTQSFRLIRPFPTIYTVLSSINRHTRTQLQSLYPAYNCNRSNSSVYSDPHKRGHSQPEGAHPYLGRFLGQHVTGGRSPSG